MKHSLEKQFTVIIKIYNIFRCFVCFYKRGTKKTRIEIQIPKNQITVLQLKKNNHNFENSFLCHTTEIFHDKL